MKSDEDEERPARERERVFVVVSEMSAMEKTSPVVKFQPFDSVEI